MSENPYAAPEAVLEGEVADESSTLGEPRGVAFGRGWSWIREAFRLFARQPWTWMGIAILAVIINGILSAIPGVKWGAGVIQMVLAGGIFFAARQTANGGSAAIRQMFRGFRERLGGLFGVGLTFVAGTLLATGLTYVLAARLGFGYQFAAVIGGSQGAGAGIPGQTWLFLLLVYFGVILPFWMAVTFAPALVLLNGVAVTDALRMSLMACLRNILPMLLYSLILIGLFILGALPLLLGLLVVLPVVTLSGYTAYRDIFYPAPA